MKIQCIKDWFLYENWGFKKDKWYTIINTEILTNGIYGVLLKSEQGINIWFWQGSDYFNIE